MSILTTDPGESLIARTENGSHQAERVRGLLAGISTADQCYVQFDLPRQTRAHMIFTAEAELPTVPEPFVDECIDVTPSYAVEGITVLRDVTPLEAASALVIYWAHH